MKIIKHVISWILVLYIAPLAIFWTICQVKELKCRDAVKSHLDKLIKFNDTVLMGKGEVKK